MTISRGQMNRQLYEGGGIMSLSKEGIGGGDYKGYDMGSRTGFGIIKKITRGAKKAVKGATKAVKKIASSDLGKAALGAAALYYMPKYGIKAAGGLKPFLVGAPTNLVTGKEAFAGILGTGGQFAPSVGKIATTLGIGGTGKGMGNIGKLATLGAVSTFLTSQFGMTEEQAEEELARDPSPYLERYYRNLNPSATEEEVASFVAANTSEYAEGGRIGYAEGTYKDFEEFMMRRSESMSERQKEELRKQFEMYMRSKDPTVEAAEGGRIKYAMGDSASDNAMQAAGIEGLPIRQNPKGVKELDLRETGGFIPPVGIKEKEDDIPAMLSNNEFVFTADAVRGMGDGDVDVGAQRMYDMMKSLEAGGRV